MKHSMDIPLHDIFPPLVVEEVSFLPLVGIILGIFIVWMVVRRMENQVQTSIVDERTKNFEQWCSIDLSDSKRAAYAISELGRYFCEEKGEIDQRYRELLDRLEGYKYAPSVPELDETTIELYRQLTQMLEPKIT